MKRARENAAKTYSSTKERRAGASVSFDVDVWHSMFNCRAYASILGEFIALIATLKLVTSYLKLAALTSST